MSASTNLCTRDDLKTHLGVTGDGYDDQLDLLIAAASEAVERWCGCAFASAEATEHYDGGGHDRLVLRRRPVTAVAGLWDDTARDFDDASEIAGDDYVLEMDAGIVRLLRGSFGDGVRNVKITYTAGYGTIPDDLAQACILIAASWFNQARGGGEGLRSQAVAGVARQFAEASMPDSVRRLLAPFRTHSI